MDDTIKVVDIPYLKNIKFTYKYELHIFETSITTTETVAGELIIPTFMDPEWVIHTYLVTYPLKNVDDKVKKRLLSISLEGADRLPEDESFYGETMILEVPEKVEEVYEEGPEVPIEENPGPVHDDRIVGQSD